MDMELNERERMLVHLAINSVISPEDPDEVMKTIEHIRKHRCRHLTTPQVKEILKDIYTEVLVSKAMWSED
tara:strand:+ start:3238 stop:3450 length:213 start_codon:yes stop_codon:yes gene_type:complete